jgi:hypothetical protein
MKDTYFPDGNKEPHVHIHKNGVTFTGVGKSHKNLEDNNGQRNTAITEVLQDLESGRHGSYGNNSRASQVAAWIRDRY